ncbi:uncharacterized protein [Anabrus simplex]|uniref:uncharacterized protein n=1 Tax=Anabrus simplex TaxID=316456 RepID=UPI0035A30F8E
MICVEIMEEPHFIKCEPEWSAETEEIFNSETYDYFPGNSLTNVKKETEPSRDPELNTEEENRDSFTECESQILKEEIIEEEEDISGRNLLDDVRHANLLRAQLVTVFGPPPYFSRANHMPHLSARRVSLASARGPAAEDCGNDWKINLESKQTFNVLGRVTYM